MKTEYEIRILEIDVNKIVKKLNDLGAKKVGEYNQKGYVYDLKPKSNGKWIRLRTNGDVTTLCYKDVVDDTINGTKEVEIVVDDFDKTNELLERIGFISRNYQENKRIQYILNGVEIDIDSWPLIPTYLEIEGSSEEEVLKIKDLLEVDESKVTTLNCEDIYNKVYNIDVMSIKELKFNE